MARRYLMQARDSVSLAMFRWIAASPDFAGLYYPGPNDAEEPAVVAIAGEEDSVSQDLDSTLASGNNAGGRRIEGLGLATGPSHATPLGQVEGLIQTALEDVATQEDIEEAVEGLATEAYADNAASSAQSAAESHADDVASAAQAAAIAAIPDASDANPAAAGAAAPGSSDDYARADHVHPAQAVPAASSATPAAVGTAAAGSSGDFSRADHVHGPQTVAANRLVGNATGSPAPATDVQVVDGMVADGAAIAGTKISPNFGAQIVQTTGVARAASPAADGDLTNRGWVNSAIAAAKLLPPIAETGTSRTLSLSDLFSTIVCSNSGSVTITVNKVATVAYPVGAVVQILQLGAGQVTIAPIDGDVTITSSETLKTRTVGAYVFLHHVATNQWVLSGERELA